MISELMRSPEFVDWSNPVNRNHPLNSGLLGWWLAVRGRTGWGSNKWRDLCRRYDATLNSVTSVTGWSGPVGRTGGMGSFLFDGTDDKIETGQRVHQPSSGTPVTLSMWLYPTVINELMTAGGVLALGLNGEWGISLNATAIMRWAMRDATPGFVSADYTLPAANRWYFVVGTTTSGGAMSLYVDGVLRDTNSIANFTAANENFLIGNRWLTTALDFAWRGYIDDVRCYSRALSAGEVWDYYNLSRQGYPGLLNRIPIPLAMQQAAAAAGNPWYYYAQQS